MDGPFWVDLRAPHMSANQASVTLAATNKAIVPLSALPVLGTNYFGYVGKAVRMRVWGQFTTGATPGNLVCALLWGNGGDANGTSILSNTAVALGATLTNQSFEWDMIVRCRALGVSGQLFSHGMFNSTVALVASTLQPVMLPNNANAAVTVDLTQNFVLSPQMNRSGSTAESVVVDEFTFEALN